MKYQVTIKNIQTIEELSTYWSTEDYVNLLALWISRCKSRDNKELRALLSMALSDYEPNEAAILLSYKLSEELRDK
jgi:hypothetical protein